MPLRGGLIATLDRVSYRYPDAAREAISEFSLDVAAGEFVLVTGASGAGKSTLLRLFNGLIPHFYGGEVRGSVAVARRDPIALGPGDMSDAVGFVFQDPEAQFVAEMVEDELAFAMENAGFDLATMRQRVDEALSAVGIAHLRGRRVSTLSGGEKQRVAIASVLTMRPRLLVLDEPTSQLDPQSADDVLDALLRLNKEHGLAVVLSEHRLERVVQHADRVLYIEQGRPPLLGPPRDVLAEMPLAPPLAHVARMLGWKPLPLTVTEARPFAASTALPAARLPASAVQHSAAQAPGIVLEGVSFSYPGGRKPIFHGLDLRVNAGEITALMGRNGSGKTTLIRLMIGLLKPGHGTVVMMGRDTRSVSLEDMSRLAGYVPQQPDVLLFADTVAAELDFTRRVHGLPPGGNDLLASLGLTPYRDHDPRDLSVGERQRVALAAVLAGSPRALLLDEPTRGLDYLQKDALAAIFRALRDAGHAVVLSTHDVEFAAHIAGRVVLLGDGEVAADGPAHEVMPRSAVFSTQVSRLFRRPDLLTVEDVAKVIGGKVE